MPMGTGQSPPPPWPWGADLKAGFWWTGVGGSGLGDPPRWAHLFVHLDVQPVRHLIVLRERAEHQWGSGGGILQLGWGGGTPILPPCPRAAALRCGSFGVKISIVGWGGHRGQPHNPAMGGGGGSHSGSTEEILADHHVVPLDFGFLRRQLFAFQLQAVEIKHDHR